MFEIYKYNVVIVFCFIIRDRKVLLIKRKNPPSKNEYTVIGGKKERYESLAEACKREVFEETGLILSNIELVGVANSYILGSEMEYLTFYFKSGNYIGNIQSSKEGDIEWCDIGESYSKEGISEFYKKIAPIVFSNTGRLFNALIVLGDDGTINDFKLSYI